MATQRRVRHDKLLPVSQAGRSSGPSVNAIDRQALSRATGGPQALAPQVQLLSNGNYHVMLTRAGAGYSRWKNLAVTRWREDATCDNWGSFCYLRDLASGDVWSSTYRPAPERGRP